ncbi:MAG: hypothetical protein HYV48_02780 [Candidatus Omnitrophica bacterium]|nr:hypothetical protein [Candidatus Omnitrophota bacterium]
MNMKSDGPRIRFGTNVNFYLFVHDPVEAMEIVRNKFHLRYVEMVTGLPVDIPLFALHRDTFKRYHTEIGEKARKVGITIGSVQTFFRDNWTMSHPIREFQEIGRMAYEAAVCQAECYIKTGHDVDHVGGHLSTVLCRHFEDKKLTAKLINDAVEHWKLIMKLAHDSGLKNVALETMSTLRELPTTFEQTSSILTMLNEYHEKNPGTTVPTTLLLDTGHGVTKEECPDERENDLSLWVDKFPHSVVEIHLKNTDKGCAANWPFCGEYLKKGVVHVSKVLDIIRRLRVPEVALHLEYSGKRGRLNEENKTIDLISKSADYVKNILIKKGYIYDESSDTWSARR